MIFKTAILQMHSENQAVSKNIDTILSQMAIAAKNHADILLLPECFITGYEMPVLTTRIGH